IKHLQTTGFVIRNITSLKPKHIDALVNYWKTKNLSVGTIKNRLTDFRYVGKLINKRNLVSANNSTYNIGTRTTVATCNRAIFNASFEKIKDQHLKLSLELQQAFGLRREECLKIMPHLADKKDFLWLKASWTKGKVERLVPIRNQVQRDILNTSKAFAQTQESLIPKNKKYIQQRHLYNRETKKLGYKNPHGLRHAYAQIRYKEITNMDSPINGGKNKKAMTQEEKHKDYTAREVIAHELGHSRISITRAYLG
ncbi:MAG: integrase, partial [Thiotrichales bacterium]